MNVMYQLEGCLERRQ